MEIELYDCKLYELQSLENVKQKFRFLQNLITVKMQKKVSKQSKKQQTYV